MRVEVIKCDVCKKEHDTQYCIPAEWIITTQRGKYNDGDDQHFCSKACLIKWARENSEEYLDHTEEYLKNLGISLELLDPKSVTLGPAAMFVQIQLLETIKDDYAKLEYALRRDK